MILNGHAGNGAAVGAAGASSPFGFHEEEAVVSFIIDFPEIVAASIDFIEPGLFTRLECKYVMTWLLKLYKNHGTVPTRELLRDRIGRHLTVDDPYREVLAIVERKSNPREVPIIRDTLKNWAESKQFGLLYSEEAILAYQHGDYGTLRNIFEGASKINGVSHKGFWFFDEYTKLLERQSIIHYKTGHARLDAALNDGGPSPGEVVIWLAATNVGKSCWLCNNSINSVKCGLDTLHVTFEMSAAKTARRCLGALTEIDLKKIYEPDKHNLIRSRVDGTFATHGAKLAIYEFNPGECSVDHIRVLIEQLRRSRGWVPKVVVIDYLELMLSQRDEHNANDYSSQKHVSTQICGLAKSENVLVYSATQANRSGTDHAVRQDVIDLNKMAESYGKAMPVDYVVSLNQSEDEYKMTPPQVRMFIAKNREGPKFETILCDIDYSTMKVKEHVL